MTTNSTKYFCNRGALSARFILVDTPLRGEYYYDGEHGKYYFGACYFDPFFGMWLSPDPAAVFFREVYAPLKWRDFIEKDILQRLNVEAVLLKHRFRASAQFANPYSYGGDPLNYVDPNGEAVHILVGAIIGAVVGTVNGVIQCASAGGGSCTKSIGVGFVGGAAVGGGAGAFAGNYMAQGYASMVGGFAGGASGSALNGGDGWDVLKGGLMGAGIAYASGWVEDFFPVKFKSETSLGVDGNFDPEQGAKKIDYASEINVKDRNSIKVLKSREAFSQERVMAQEHLKNIGDRRFEYLGAYEVKTGKLACPECLTTDYSENSVTTNRSINNALRWNSGVRLIHNQPRTMIPSANDYIGASMFRNSSLYIIHTNSSAIFKNGLYQFTSSPDNAKNTLQHIYY